MYSVLVTTLMGMSATTPSFGWFNNSGGNGCAGCNGNTARSAGCNGCSGGGGGFLGLGLFDRSSNGSRYGGSSCYGCNGCSGGCHGCYGSAVHSYSVPAVYGAGVPFQGGHMPYAAPPIMPGHMMTPPPDFGGMAMPPAGLSETIAPPTALGEASAAPNQVTLVVTLPPDAKLYAEKQLIPLTGSVRTFVTPSLEPGRTYYYDLTIEVLHGKPVQKTQTVDLRVGNVSRVLFPEPAG